MTAEDLGAIYVRDDGSIWRLVSYAAEPTASLECVFPCPTATEVVLGHRTRVGGVVGSRIFEGFERLAPVNDRPVVGLVDPEVAFWRGRPYALDSVPSYTYSTHDAAARCPGCERESFGEGTAHGIEHEKDCRAMRALRVLRGHEA